MRRVAVVSQLLPSCSVAPRHHKPVVLFGMVAARSCWSDCLFGGAKLSRFGNYRALTHIFTRAHPADPPWARSSDGCFSCSVTILRPNINANTGRDSICFYLALSLPLGKYDLEMTNKLGEQGQNWSGLARRARALSASRLLELCHHQSAGLAPVADEADQPPALLMSIVRVCYCVGLVFFLL